MAEQTAKEQQQQQAASESEETNGGKNGGDTGRKTAVRAAAIAAATSATAIAAKKAFSGREASQSGEKKSRSGGSGNEDSMVGTMIASGWHAAKDSLLPFAEEAAGSAGEYLARSGPDFVRETLVPRFIRGFEQAQKSAESAS